VLYSGARPRPAPISDVNLALMQASSLRGQISLSLASTYARRANHAPRVGPPSAFTMRPPNAGTGYIPEGSKKDHLIPAACRLLWHGNPFDCSIICGPTAGAANRDRENRSNPWITSGIKQNRKD